MPATDLAAPLPRGKLSSKFRRKLGDSNDSSNSLASSSTSEDPNAEQSLRPSTSDGAGGRLKNRLRRKSVDDRRGSNDAGKRLSNLMPGRKDRPKKTDWNEPERQLSADSGTGNLGLLGNQSDSSIGLAGSGRSSLLTDGESDHEGKPIRPPLSTHASHIGYLTLSSPEINSQTQPVITGSDVFPSPEAAPITGSTTSIPQIIEPSNTEPLLPSVVSERTTSPVEKVKGAFSLPRKGSVAETDSVKSAGSGQGGLSGFFRPSSRKSSVKPEEIVEPKSGEEIAQPGVQSSQAPSGRNEVQGDDSQERPETPKQRGRPRINTASLPQTPPNLTETPTTFVTPPTPTDPGAEFPRSSKKSTPTRNRSDTLSSVDSIKRRRSQSNTVPSKLSQSIPAPLTPTAEETKTPGGTLAHPASAAGFFSSFVSQAQKAAVSLSNINIVPNQKTKPANARSIQEQGGEEVIPDAESQLDIEGADGEKRLSAVETLGKGDLSFSHLGITEESSPMTSTTDLPLQNGTVSADEANKKAEEDAAARAVSQAYEKPVAAVVSQAVGGHGGSRPLSIASNDRLTLTGEQTPPRSGTDVEGIKRSGSVRSKLSGRRRRHRASSATNGTVNTIAAGLAASTTGLQNLTVNGGGHRLTGFAVASSKRNKDFHQLFRSVPEDDYLIEDYSAALQRDILLHGRLYVSEGHICFSSNILGWVTNLVISFDEVVSVEKKSTAVIFPNAIIIQTLQARNTFASFVARDSTYELLIGIWKISHPNLKSSLNGVTLDDAGTGDKTEVAEPEGSEAGSETGSEDEVYDEDADDDAGSFDDAGLAPSIAGSDIGDTTLSRKTSGAPLAPTAPQTNGIVAKGLELADAVVTGAAVTSDFPGPPTHSPTQCTDEHYDRPLIDILIPAPLGKIYSLMFGPASGAFMRKWLVEDQKSRDLSLPDDKAGLDNDHKSVTFDYIKPLSGSIGPKQTKCITTNTLMAFDLEKVVTIDGGTQTPDVPSGNVFVTKTRYCLMWGASNSTRLIASCTVEWSGKSWLKGPIEKGANDGQIEYIKALTAALNAAVTTKPPVKGTARKGKRKGKKEVFDADEANAQRHASVAAEQQATTWGPLEPLHQALSPFISLLSPFINSQVIIAILATLLIYTWISPPTRGGMSIGFPGYTSPERLAAYEEIWRREESNLWDWLEDRVGLDGIYVPSGDGRQKDRQKALAARNMGKKADEERMNQRQMDDAIRVTEERLSALKEAVTRKKSGKKPVERS